MSGAGDSVRRCEEDDGLYLPEIKRHSLEKIAIHNRYAELFATAVRKKWPQRAYVGLYAGAGRARVVPTGEIVETSALVVVRQMYPFTHYVFADNNETCLGALRQRIEALNIAAACEFVPGDVNGVIAEIRRALPSYRRGMGLLSFCFVDPFDMTLQFSTIRALGDLRMDFLVLLMLGLDARRNLRSYLHDPTSTRVGDLIDSPDWRREFQDSGNRSIVKFILTRFDAAMSGLGYMPTTDDTRVSVYAAGTRVLQYILAFYTKSSLGQKLFKAARQSLTPQLGLDL